MSGCTYPDCAKPATAKRLCRTHYMRQRRTGSTDLSSREAEARPACGVDGCSRPAYAFTFCSMHYQRFRKTGDPGPAEPERGCWPSTCTVDGCGRGSKVRGLCELHARRVARSGNPGDPGPRVPTGRHVTGQGYVMVQAPGHPNADRLGRVLEHRYVMAELLGRPLLPEETVHHRNGSRTDNRPENLELWSNRQPPGQRVADKVEWALHLLELYAPDRLVTAGSRA